MTLSSKNNQLYKIYKNPINKVINRNLAGDYLKLTQKERNLKQ